MCMFRRVVLLWMVPPLLLLLFDADEAQLAERAGQHREGTNVVTVRRDNSVRSMVGQRMSNESSVSKESASMFGTSS